MAAGTGVFRQLGVMRMGEPVRGPRAVEAGSAAIPGEAVRKKRNLKHSSDTSNYLVYTWTLLKFGHAYLVLKIQLLLSVLKTVPALYFFWKLDFLSGVFEENA